MIKKLLIAYDGSESAKQAFDVGMTLAHQFNAEVYVLAVARPPEFGTEVESEAVLENSRKHYEKVLAPLKKRLAGEAKPASTEVVIGHPAEQIVRYAEAHGVDHIVVGHRGHTLFERWLIGSVARQVIAYAHCTVTVVRQVEKG